MNHKEIVAYLTDHHNVGPWWRQTVTVTYELARGLRDRHEKPVGYEVSVSKTIPGEIGDVFDAFNDEKIRRRWLAEKGLKVRTATRPKTVRITWNDDNTSVEVYLVSKGDAKTQTVVQHRKLENGKEAAAKKLYWAEKLEGLKLLFNSAKRA
jgi:uncharacterized protein YndB with AHSA1/START domain